MLLKSKEAGEDIQMLAALKSLERSLQNFSIGARTENVFDVNSLQNVAAIRAALNILWKYLDENFDENLRKYNNLQTLLDVTKRLCESENRSPIRLFLLKQLVRKYGIDNVKKRCEKKELQWILPPESQVM